MTRWRACWLAPRGGAVLADRPVFETLPLLLEHYGRVAGEQPALLAPDRAVISYGGLLRWVEQSRARLRRFGIGRADRVAVIAPIGMDAALATIAVAAAAVCVPLNPALKADEWRRYFAELDLVAVLSCMEGEHPGVAAAAALGLAVIRLEGGVLTLDSGRRRGARDRAAVGADDAFVLLTSGTTSRPKLVPLSHASVCRSGANAGASLGLGGRDRLLHMLPLHHAHGLLSGLLAGLAAGSSVVCTGGFDGDQLFRWIAAFEPSWYTAVPAIHRMVLAAAMRHRAEAGSCSLRVIRSASSSLPADLLEGLEACFGVPVIETYGMTEAASQIAANPLEARKLNSVGRSAGAEIAIVDDAGRSLGAGARGEIVLRGPTLTLGYGNDAEATAAAFRGGWFHTGDLGFLDGDGYLFILGRLRDIIDRGGQKIAPAEVEQVLLGSDGVAEVVAFPMPHRQLGEVVAAAVVLRPGAKADARGLRALARRHLAEYKVPARIAFVREIPKTALGKVNRSGLAVALGLVVVRGEAGLAPRSELEAGLVALWSEVLQLDRIGVDEDVFALGAESLAAMQMLARLRVRFGVDLAFEDLLNAPTVAGLAVRVRGAPRFGAVAVTGGKKRGARGTPLSFQQLRMQVLSGLDQIGSVYHVLEVARLSGALDGDALEASFERLCARHEVLRARFFEQGEEAVQGPGAGFVLERVDAGSGGAGVIRRQALDLVHRGFALEAGPPLRARLVRLGVDDHVLIVVVHHIVTDGWSQSLFWEELRALYAAARSGGPAVLAPARLQYRDYVAWQRGWLETAEAGAQAAYWRGQLDGLTALALPVDRRPLPQRSGRGARYPVRLSRGLTGRLKAFSRAHRVTLFMTILAGFQTVLHRHAGQDDIAVGSLLANRNQVVFESLFGMLVNTVILRTDFSGDPSVAELLRRVRAVTVGAHRHGDLPIERVTQVIRAAPGTERHAAFRTMLILQKADRSAPSLTGLQVERIDVDPGTAHQDLLLELRERDERLDGWLEYSTDLFDRATIGRLAGHFRMALESMIADAGRAVSRLELSPVRERRMLRAGWGMGPVDGAYRGAGFVQRFLVQARATPDAVAVSAGSGGLSYRELAARSRGIAGRLAAEGVGPERIVVLLAERDADLLAGMIAVQWVGAAFLLLDPSHPRARLAAIIDRSGAAVVLARGWRQAGVRVVDLAAALDGGGDPGPPRRAAASGLAYAVYTSGSTGVPKGAMIEQRGLMNHLVSKVRDLPLAAGDVVAQTAPASFDIAVWQLLAPLLAGARVHIVAGAVVGSPAALWEEVRRAGVTVLQVVPALLAGLVEVAAGGLGALRVLLVTGEAVGPEVLRAWFRRFPGVTVVNAYGPAECADDVATHWMRGAPDARRAVPIGRPIANTQLYVLDGRGALMPAGVAGVLHVGGVGVGRGYLGDAVQTAAHFLPDRFGGKRGRLYCTGDLARWRNDGVLEFVGRVDDQIKLRGHRIEPGEIERSLLDQDGVAGAAVVLGQDGRLTAFFVGEADVEAMRAALKLRLPGAMVPSVFVRLTHMPLTRNGKVDRRALRGAPGAVAGDGFGVETAPRTPAEVAVAAVWAEVLGLARVGVTADFFDLGGHSLLAGKVLARLARDWGRAPSLRAFFAAPTVEGLARALEASGPAGMGGAEVGGDVGLPSLAQEDVLRSEWALPGLPQFNLPFVYRLRGPLNVGALERSVAALVRRHESLRTGFVLVDGQSRAVVAAADGVAVPFSVLDLAAGAGSMTAAVERLLVEKARLLAEEAGWVPFDMGRPPLVRFRLLRLGADDHVLVMVMHHVIVDGWSIGILMEELSALYAGHGAALAGSAPAYSAFAGRQRAWSARPEQFAYWRKRLHRAQPVFRADCGEGAILEFPVEHAPLDLSAKLVEALAALGREAGVTLFTTLLAGFKVLLMARSARTDLCVATAMANRSALWTERMVGPVENTAVIRSRMVGRGGFRAVLGRVGAATTEAFERQRLPFETVARRLQAETGLSPASLVQAFFVMRDAAPEPLCFPGISVAPFGDAHRHGQAVLPVDRTWISVSLKPVGPGVSGTFSAKAGLLGGDAAIRWATDYRAVLQRVVVDPDAMLRDLVEL